MTAQQKLTEFEAELKAAASHLVEKFHALVAEIKAEVLGDGKQLATEAETAAAPVAASAEQDAAQLAKAAAETVTGTPPAAPKGA